MILEKLCWVGLIRSEKCWRSFLSSKKLGHSGLLKEIGLPWK
ncbi:Uncharacterized protein APZ42_026692 [Daphnia magna]|uniref:Uncharacterized protein n=1 Tax=Daphnia magna TaxID=35525 RepID=A0A162ECY6_9CRUS|nr:Uncharacterized protein APZ42_026692 [Daphnia magna]